MRNDIKAMSRLCRSQTGALHNADYQVRALTRCITGKQLDPSLLFKRKI